MDLDKEIRELEALVEGGIDGSALMKKFMELDTRRQQLEREAKDLKRQCDELQAPVLQFMGQMGIQNTRINGRLLHIVKRITGKPKDGNKQHVCEVLQNTGYKDIVKPDYHWKKMQALLEEADRNDEELPQELLDAIEVKEEFKVQTRK